MCPLSILFVCFCCCCCFVFWGLCPWHMEVPGLGVVPELQLLAYTTAIATPDPSCVCDLHHSLWQRRIFNLLSEARNEPETSWFLVPDLFLLCYDGNSPKPLSIKQDTPSKYLIAGSSLVAQQLKDLALSLQWLELHMGTSTCLGHRKKKSDFREVKIFKYAFYNHWNIAILIIKNFNSYLYNELLVSAKDPAKCFHMYYPIHSSWKPQETPYHHSHFTDRETRQREAKEINP